MLGLASGLRKAGHSVDLVVTSLDNRSYADTCRLMSIGYRQVPEQVGLDLQAFARQTFRMNGLQWLNALLAEGFFPYQDLLYQISLELVADYDLVVGHNFLFPLKLAARQAGKPHVSVTLCHVAIPSKRLPPFRFPNLGPMLNPMQWRLFNALFDVYLKRDLGRLWRAHGQRIDHGLFADLLTSDHLDLVAVDPVFCPDADDWPAPHQVCGFLNLEDDAQAWTMPAEMESFLEEGHPPVYFSFGSLQQAVPEWAMDLFMETVRRVGCRAFIQTSSPRFPAGVRQGDVLFVGCHPHQPVFERCAAVVHHGGAGTTHAATRAGCPSVVVPFMDEQLFWQAIATDWTGNEPVAGEEGECTRSGTAARGDSRGTRLKGSCSQLPAAHAGNRWRGARRGPDGRQAAESEACAATISIPFP